MHIAKDERVFHKTWGNGKILFELSGGYELLVNFENYGKIKVRRNECSFNKEAKPIDDINDLIYKALNLIKKNPNGINGSILLQDLGITREKLNELIPKVTRIDGVVCDTIFNENSEDLIIKFNLPEPKQSSLQRRKMIEAFRLGIVPGFAVTEITVGRKKEIKIVEEWLKKNNDSLLIIGQYGQGKSHIIRYIREQALNEGFLVAYCDIGSESPMHRPKLVFNTLMKSLSFKTDDGTYIDNGIESFLKLYANYLVKSKEENLLQNNIFLKWGFKSIISRIENNSPIENLFYREFIDYLTSGDKAPHKFERLPDHQTTANIFCNIISSIGHIANITRHDSQFRFKGIILIFDEGESVDSPQFISSQRDKGQNFIRGLAEISRDNQEIVNEHILKNINYEYIGQSSRLRYSGVHKKIRFSDFSKNYVKCLFSFVEGQSEITHLLENEYNFKKIILDEMSQDEKKALIRKVSKIYGEAYDFRVSDMATFEDKVLKMKKKSTNTRSVIKITVEGLDLIRANPDADMDVILRDE